MRIAKGEALRADVGRRRQRGALSQAGPHTALRVRHWRGRKGRPQGGPGGNPDPRKRQPLDGERGIRIAENEFLEAGVEPTSPA